MATLEKFPEIYFRGRKGGPPANLEASGYTKSVAKDGVTTLYSKGNQIYSVYSNAASTGGPAANLAIDGQVVAKIRLK